jgi:hypothetical protein
MTFDERYSVLAQPRERPSGFSTQDKDDIVYKTGDGVVRLLRAYDDERWVCRHVPSRELHI